MPCQIFKGTKEIDSYSHPLKFRPSLGVIVEPPGSSVGISADTVTSSEFGRALLAAGRDHLSTDTLGAGGDGAEDDVGSGVAHADLGSVGAADFSAGGTAG